MGKRKGSSSILSLRCGLAAILMLLGGLAFGKVTAEAAETSVDGVTYTLDGDTVTITGTGERTTYGSIIDWNSDSLQGVTHVKFENCKISGSLRAAFSDVSRLISIDLSGLDTSSVTNMSSVFYCCSGLTSLDVSGWDTSNVKKWKGCFASAAA